MPGIAELCTKGNQDKVAQFYSAAISLLDTSEMIRHQSLLSALLTLMQSQQL